MASIEVPGTIREATARLRAVDKLVTATEWERAAIVAAFVRLPGSGSKGNLTSEVSSAEDFAARGINGLRSPQTVRLYVTRWLEASNGKYPQPGRKVKLPTAEWPPTRTGTDGYESDDGVQRTIDRMVERHGADKVAGVVIGRPSVDKAISQARLDRVSSQEQRQGIVDRGRQRDALLDRDLAEGKAQLAEHIDHEAELAVEGALNRLRTAVKAKEQYPYFSNAQRQRMLGMLDE